MTEYTRRRKPDPLNKKTRLAILAIIFVALLLIVIDIFVGLQNFAALPASQLPISPVQPTQPAQPAQLPPSEYHIHVDFALYINGERFNFSRPRFDVSNALPKGRFAHMHIANPDGDKVIHVHAKDVPLTWFFEGIRMNVTSNCLAAEEGERHCNNINMTHNTTLKVFVQNFGGNWKQIENFEEYVPLDLDRILVTYGDEDAAALQAQMQSVGNFSANYSGPPSVG